MWWLDVDNGSNGPQGTLMRITVVFFPENGYNELYDSKQA